jgi:hypothetical protein
MVMMEVTMMFSWNGPKFPETLYALFFWCCALVSIRKEFSAITPPSWVDWFTSAWEAACDGVRRAGTKAREYVLSIHHRARSAGEEAWISVSGIYDRIWGSGN